MRALWMAGRQLFVDHALDRVPNRRLHGLLNTRLPRRLVPQIGLWHRRHRRIFSRCAPPRASLDWLPIHREDTPLPFLTPRDVLMVEGLVYLVSSFWLGALHAATPGHGKTIAASYIVGARGRSVDALVLGIFVTLSHTSGIILVAVLVTLGSAWLVPHRVEAYLAVGTAMLVIGIGFWMLRTQIYAVPLPRGDGDGQHHHAHRNRDHEHEHKHDRDHPHRPHEHEHGYHTHGWGRRHTHNIEAITQTRPSLGILLGLGIAGGLLPDPGALAILLATIASGKLMLGLFTVLVFSVGFASVLVVVGVVAARVGQLVLTWLSSRWMAWLQVGLALLIVCVGIILTVSAWRTIAALS